jgi:hypothetical protein
MPSSIRRLVALDHDRMHRLVRRACAPGPSQERWRDELVHLVRAHLTAESGALTPDVVAQAGDGASVTAEEVRRTSDDLASRADAIADLPVGTPELTEAGRSLEEALTAHTEVLERDLLGRLESAVPRKEVRRLGGVYAERRDAALYEEGEEGPPPRRLDLSRAELYELAKKAGIAGRSAMSRKDLISELQRRQQRAR